MVRTAVRVAVLLVAVGLLAEPAGAQSPLAASDLYRLRSVGDVVFSPDATRIAYTVTSNLNFESTGGVIAKIRLVGGLFARGATNVAGAATGLPGFKTVGLLSSSSVPTETSVDLSEGSVVSGLTGTPTRFRWQTQIFPLNDQLHSVGGLSFRVCDENCN